MDADTLILVYAIPIVGLIISILTFASGVKQRQKKDVAEMTAIGIKLDHHTEKLERIESMYEQSSKEQQGHATRITRLETEVKNFKIKLNELEQELKDLEDKTLRSKTC
jgi:chromosome segregation ATPase